jgi:L-malate glycosyltransferase
MSRPLSIGVVCYASLGGSGIVAAELAGGLAVRGHRVHLIASAPPARALPLSERLAFHQVAVPSHPVLQHPLYGLALAETIVDVVRRHALDLLHVHYAVPHAASAYLACRTLGDAAPRVVLTMHGSDVTGFGVTRSYEAVTRFAVGAADALTVPSEFLRREAERLLALGEASPIAVIPNAVDADRFAPVAHRDRARFDDVFPAERRGEVGDGGPVLVHVSNFRPVKRVGDAIEVLAHLRRTLPARLVLVGDGPERAHAVARAHELGVAAHVAFLGVRTDFAARLPHADAFVLPSETESFGVAALEALSAGVPVFAYRVGGLPEVVGDDGGALVAPFDVAALARAVLDVVGDPARRAAVGAAARARVLARFRREPVLDRYEACFRRALERPRATP